tara:strand:- start:3048 stop:3266 length:219 start_codon:yes stop_codon:yes gene_type:complete
MTKKQYKTLIECINNNTAEYPMGWAIKKAEFIIELSDKILSKKYNKNRFLVDCNTDDEEKPSVDKRLKEIGL